MPHTTVTAGLSIKRPGAEQYSSDGYHLTVEMEAEIENADRFRAVSQALFAEVKAALEAGEKTVDLWGAGGNGGNGRKPASREDAPSDTPPADRSRSHSGPETPPAPISNKQAKFLWQLARKGGMRTQDEVAGWLRDKLGVDRGVYQLTKVEASKAIDLLNNGNGGAKR
jgi:hypothetical protein